MEVLASRACRWVRTRTASKVHLRPPAPRRARWPTIRVPRSPIAREWRKPACERLPRLGDRGRGAFADGQWLGYMWDEPEIVAPERLSVRASRLVVDDVEPAGEIGRFEFPPDAACAEVVLSGGIELEMRAPRLVCTRPGLAPQRPRPPTINRPSRPGSDVPFAHGPHALRDPLCQLPVRPSLKLRHIAGRTL